MLKVIQCWDDGVTADIALIEILRKYGARATFNLNGGLHGKVRGGEWTHRETRVERLAMGELTDVYEGFTIANHSLTHPHLEDLEQKEMAKEIGDSRKFLQDLFGQPVEGFAYPFGTWNDRVVETLKKEGHLYGRTVENGLWSDTLEEPLLLSPACHFLDDSFRDLYEASREPGVFYFWGHSYEIINKAMLADFEEKIRWISEDPASEWDEILNVVSPAQ